MDADTDITPLGLGEGPAKVISVSLPAGTVAALREAVGARGVSAFVAAAVEQELRHRAMDQYLADYQAEHGAFTEEELAAADDMWKRAEEVETQWLRAG